MIAGLFDHNFMNNIEGNSMKLSRLKGEVLSGDETALLTHKTTPSSLLQQVFLLSNSCEAKKYSTNALRLSLTQMRESSSVHKTWMQFPDANLDSGCCQLAS